MDVINWQSDKGTRKHKRTRERIAGKDGVKKGKKTALKGITNSLNVNPRLGCLISHLFLPIGIVLKTRQPQHICKINNLMLL